MSRSSRSAGRQAPASRRPQTEEPTEGASLAHRIGRALGQLIQKATATALPPATDPELVPSQKRPRPATRRRPSRPPAGALTDGPPSPPTSSEQTDRTSTARNIPDHSTPRRSPARSPGRHAVPEPRTGTAPVHGSSEAPSGPAATENDPPLPRPRLTGAARRYAAIIEQTLAEFGAPVRVVHAEVGPMLIRLGIVPGYVDRRVRGQDAPRRERVRAAKVVSRQNDLALALGVSSLRIEAPVPGKPYIGIEVPNPHPRPVLLPPLLAEPEFTTLAEHGILPLALGRDVAGRPIVADLARLPHLLIAGATGAGKSVAMNALLGTLLRTRGRDALRVIVIDPKRVEFTWLEDVPHLLAPVVTDPEQAVEVLGKVETEMAYRYDLLADARVRNLLAYNARADRTSRPALPALVVIVDELADLMMLAPDDVERSICRLAQLGRAAGIHLVIATQRPSVDVVTGLIKANLPARLAFAVSSLVDSRTILDAPGAERLLGRGDFLYLAPDALRPVRGQGALARDAWLKQTVAAARAAADGGPDHHAERFARLPSAARIAEDRLYAAARELAAQYPGLSTSFLQRKLRVGFARAEALIERLRADGLIADPELDDG